MDDPLITVEHEHTFTAAERAALGEELAVSNANVYELRGQKKVATAEINAQIQVAEAKSATITGKLRVGTELRTIQARIRYDSPRRGMAEIFSTETGELLITRHMTPEELQSKLDFEGRAN